MARVGSHIRYGDWKDMDTFQVFLSLGNANYAIKQIDKDYFRGILGEHKTFHVHAPYCINLAVNSDRDVSQEIASLQKEIEEISIQEEQLKKGLEDQTLPKRKNTGKLKKLGCDRRRLEKQILTHKKDIEKVARDKSIVTKSYKSLRNVLVQIEGLPAATVFHFGSRGSMKNVARRVMTLAEQGYLKPGCERVPVKLLGEVSAGQGNSVGKTWEELEEFFSNVDRNLVGLCLDTAHLFGSGMCDFKDRDSIDELFARCDSLQVRVGLIHLNDSKAAFKSMRDKHQAHLFGHIWNADNYWYFLSVCKDRGIDVVTESAPGPDYALMKMVKDALPFVPTVEESHQILSEYTCANPETALHYLVLNKMVVATPDCKESEKGEIEKDQENSGEEGSIEIK